MFHIADSQDIKAGRVTDVYFKHTIRILEEKKILKRAVGEVTLKNVPPEWAWGVLAGIEEMATLLEGLPINVWAMPEGTIFAPEQPVVVMEGRYIDYAVYETAMLGLLCQASGIATKSARCKKAAGDKPVISFGARRMHPAMAPMIERNAFIGGCDGVAVVESAELIAEKPRGTMPHALVMMFGDTVAAARAFDEVINPTVSRVALVDTFSDEKVEALRVAQALGEKLFAVRLDTPSSRRGNMLKILQEVRWELDLRGYQGIKLFVSGGLDENDIVELNPAADAYGVGTSISNAQVVDFSFDLVEIEGQPIAKKGKLSGFKQVLRCDKCHITRVVPRFIGDTVPASQSSDTCPTCQSPYRPLLTPLIQEGKLVRELPAPQAIRRYVLEQLKYIEFGM